MEITEMISFIKENSEFYSNVDFGVHTEAQIRRIYHLLKFEKNAKDKSKSKDFEQNIPGPHFF